MISITSAQLESWLALFTYPMSRILGFIAVMPVFSNAAIPARVRIVVGLAIGLGLAPMLPPMPEIPIGSWLGLGVMAQQALIGILMGFTFSLAFAAINTAGELIGLQMGLSFAVFFDRNSTGQTPVITEFLTIFSALVFLSINGHLLALSVLAESFQLLPVSATPFAAAGFAALVKSAAMVFSFGLMLALPIIVALLVANISLGVLSRVAPTLNLFAVGFPITLATGFLVLNLSLPQMGNAFQSLYDAGFSALGIVLRAGVGSP